MSLSIGIVGLPNVGKSTLFKTLTKNGTRKYGIIFLAVLFLSLVDSPALARDPQNITDWYIKNFNSSIVINQDSSLLITENITADAGNLPNKHGIFRILPTQNNTDKGIFKTPIQLISITDFNGNPYQYQTINDRYSNTITWKIGDPNKTVTGENNYKIVYKVENAVRFGNPDFDELYWNLLGNFWSIDIDNFSVKITLPNQVNQQNTKVYYYAGVSGSNANNLATYTWLDNNALLFSSTNILRAGQGVTVSLAFLKNIFTPYRIGFLEKYSDVLSYLFFLIPLIIFITFFWLWLKFGKDPKMRRPIPPEFGVPENISPMQMGVILKHGSWDNKFISASIIDLAVRKFIKIEEIDHKVLFITTKDYRLIKSDNYKNIATLTEAENILLSGLFGNADSIILSETKTSFYQTVQQIKDSVIADVVKNGWIVKFGNTLRALFIALALGSVWLGFAIGGALNNLNLSLSFCLSSIIMIIFGFLMPKRTQKGVNLLFKIKGFELYMRQAEDYRQQFYEKENIFDKFLPYAIIFGITKLWAKKMEKIYGQDFYRNYYPVWYGGRFENFNADNFASHMNGIVTGIANSTGTASGAGGSGGAGGGGGGGGGGGW